MTIFLEEAISAAEEAFAVGVEEEVLVEVFFLFFGEGVEFEFRALLILGHVSKQQMTVSFLEGVARRVEIERQLVNIFLFGVEFFHLYFQNVFRLWNLKKYTSEIPFD